MSTLISVLPNDILDILNAHLNDGPQTPGQRFLRLPHPRTGLPALFLPYTTATSNSSLLEVHFVEPTAPRSWFNGGEIIEDGRLLVMTPVDPTFLLVPLLRVVNKASDASKPFRTMDDIFDLIVERLEQKEDPSLAVEAKDIHAIFEYHCVKEAMKRVCEHKEITPELDVYRYSHEKFVAYLTKKVTRLSESGDVDKSRTLERQLAKDGLLEDGKEDLLKAGRLKLACDLISQYIDPDTLKELENGFDFSSLNAHITALDEAAAANTHETSSEQKKKKSKDNGKETETDGKKRKAGAQSNSGVGKLKKANIKGMSKLSSFFGKKSEGKDS